MSAEASPMAGLPGRNGMSMLATELLAYSQSLPCSGPDRCHWCSAPCERKWPHDDEPISPFIRTRSTAKCPGNAYICNGCWIYRKPRVTVQHLDGSIEDRKTLTDYSWYLTRQGVWVIGKWDFHRLYEILLKPPKKFSLSIVTDEKNKNLIQLALVNDLADQEMKANTPLAITINNTPFVYSVYDLEEAIKGNEGGILPGARELVKILGAYRQEADTLPNFVEKVDRVEKSEKTEAEDKPGKSDREEKKTRREKEFRNSAIRTIRK